MHADHRRVGQPPRGDSRDWHHWHTAAAGLPRAAVGFGLSPIPSQRLPRPCNIPSTFPIALRASGLERTKLNHHHGAILQVAYFTNSGRRPAAIFNLGTRGVASDKRRLTGTSLHSGVTILIGQFITDATTIILMTMTARDPSKQPSLETKEQPQSSLGNRNPLTNPTPRACCTQNMVPKSGSTTEHSPRTPTSKSHGARSRGPREPGLALSVQY